MVYYCTDSPIYHGVLLHSSSHRSWYTGVLLHRSSNRSWHTTAQLLPHIMAKTIITSTAESLYVSLRIRGVRNGSHLNSASRIRRDSFASFSRRPSFNLLSSPSEFTARGVAGGSSHLVEGVSGWSSFSRYIYA